MTLQTTTIDLMRHGEPQGGVLLRGSTDHSLTETGWSQMRGAVAGRSGWSRIISSPLSRCRAFAEELAQQRGLQLHINHSLSEIHFGEWEGRSVEDVQQTEPEELAAFWVDPLNNTPPGAEPLSDFRQRVLSAWTDLIKQHRGEHVLVTAHGGVNRIIMAEVLGMPLANLFRIEVPYACLPRIVVDQFDGQTSARLVSHLPA